MAITVSLPLIRRRQGGRDGRLGKMETADLHSTKMQKEMVIQKLREKGCRITKQRLMLLDVILQEECASCKEIYYRAKQEDDRIGTATIYRMVNLLEEIGAISRKNMYKISMKSCGRADG